MLKIQSIDALNLSEDDLQVYETDYHTRFYRTFNRSQPFNDIIW